MAISSTAHGPTVLTHVTIASLSAQTLNEKFWLAGRYDGNRVIVYFSAAKFGNKLPPKAVEIAPPVASAFFQPFALPAEYIAKLERAPGIERFGVGKHYDLLLGGDVGGLRLTTLVGAPGDEEVGNDSYIGALATSDSRNALILDRDYYVVRPHTTAKSASRSGASPAKEPARFDMQEQIASLLTSQLSKLERQPRKVNLDGISPRLAIQMFTLPNGSVRYYARAEWKAPEEAAGDSGGYTLAAWVGTRPRLSILAIQQQTSEYGFDNELPQLLNVVDLGHGKAGLVVSISGEDSTALMLLEYHTTVSQSTACGCCKRSAMRNDSG